MARLGSEEQDPRWIVTDMSDRQDKQNVGHWYSSERDLTKEGRARLEGMLQGVDLVGLGAELGGGGGEGGWSGSVTSLSGCEGEILFFDRTVNGVRKPTTVVDVQVRPNPPALVASPDPHHHAAAARAAVESQRRRVIDAAGRHGHMPGTLHRQPGPGPGRHRPSDQRRCQPR